MACATNIRSLGRLDKRWLAKQTLVLFLKKAVCRQMLH